MDKDGLRERVWDALEAEDVARFPFPPHGRIPNFDGADAAADRLATRPEWTPTGTVKANPDAPQLPVRRAALRAGKTVFMAVPRLSAERCFRRLDPAVLDDPDGAATIGGSADHGEPVAPASMSPVELVVVGSVAVDTAGGRVGKGEGYSDLEFAILAEGGLVGPETTVVTTVHELQIRAEPVPHAAHDVPIDLVVTPDRVIETATRYDRPAGIDWAALETAQIDAMPILARLQD